MINLKISVEKLTCTAWFDFFCDAMHTVQHKKSNGLVWSEILYADPCLPNKFLHWADILLVPLFQYVPTVEGMVKSYLNIAVNAMVKDEYGLIKILKLKFLLVLAQAVF
ncbi:hypothetical protein GLYMA_13G366333v4 [Glycine max]|nr:hypothetical protein GLYMA_13G366333v4 [Glycine max]KAH1105271.1 hypothetical protein GYH30_038504 [Glycine max]